MQLFAFALLAILALINLGVNALPTLTVAAITAAVTEPAIYAGASSDPSISNTGSETTISTVHHEMLVPTGLVMAPGPASLTITVVNSYGSPLSTAHALGEGSAAVGNVGSGTMAAGASATFTAPQGWTGNVAVNDAKYGVDNADASLIEANLKYQAIYDTYVVDFDISYV